MRRISREDGEVLELASYSGKFEIMYLILATNVHSTLQPFGSHLYI